MRWRAPPDRLSAIKFRSGIQLMVRPLLIQEVEMRIALSWACYWIGCPLSHCGNWLLARSARLQGESERGPWLERGLTE